MIGAGTLGMLVARRWKTLNPAAKINLKFRSDNSERNSALVEEGFTVVSKESGEGVRAGVVVFCAPPTGNNDYAEDILASVTDHWSPSDPGSVFVFTSAGSVYQENSGAEVDEMSATVRTERSGKLLDGEQHVVAAGGCVLRLGGLYSGDQGAHNFWCGGGAETKDKRKHNSRGAREGMHVWTPVPHTFRSRMRRLPAPLCGECVCVRAKKAWAPRNSVNVSAVRTPPLKLAAARLLAAI